MTQYMMTLTPPENFSPKFEIVSCFCEHNGKFVLLKRQDHKSEPNTYGVPAGKKEGNETVLEAIQREIQEETGLVLNENKINFFNTVYVRYPSYDFIYHMFHAILEWNPLISINHEEHKDFAWATPSEALQMNLIGWLDECIKEYYKIY